MRLRFRPDRAPRQSEIHRCAPRRLRSSRAQGASPQQPTPRASSPRAACKKPPANLAGGAEAATSAAPLMAPVFADERARVV
eukprot:12222068-Alexandrium_andersonii.AAC.1